MSAAAGARPNFDLSLYLVIGSGSLGSRSLAEVVTAAVHGGVSLVQLRDKTASDTELAAQARSLKALLDPHDVPLIINDRVEIAVACGAAGLHVGQDDLSPAAARDALGPGKVLGVSAGTPEEMAVVDPALVDYVGVGPVYPTGTKADAGAAIGLAGLRDMRRRIALPVVAIGGIDEARASEVMTCGVEGLAVVSAICSAADPEQAARRLRQAVDRAVDRGRA